MSPQRLVKTYLDCGASQFAGMLGFSLFVSMVPLAAGVFTLWALVAHNIRRFTIAGQLLAGVFPRGARGQVLHALVSAAQHAGTIGVFSILGLVWFSTGLFSTAGFALNRIHGLHDRSFFQQRLRGLWLPLALALAVNLAVGVNVAIKIRSLPSWIGVLAIWVALIYVVGFLYRLAPSRMPRRSEIWPGAVLASTAIVALSYALPVVASMTDQFSTESKYFATVAGLVTWVYLIAQAFLIGAVLNRALVDARGLS